MISTSGDALSQLFARLQARARRDIPSKNGHDLPPDTEAAPSYTQSLLQQGTDRIAQKVGEEAVETVIAALVKSKTDVVNESADLIYHLLVLWLAVGVTPDDIYKELDRRATKRHTDGRK